MKLQWASKSPRAFTSQLAWGMIGLVLLLIARFAPLVETSLFPCFFHRLTTIPCPSCGGTRAFTALAHGRVREGILFNPLAALLFFSFVVFIPYTLSTIPARRRLVPVGKFGRRGYAILIGLLLINWAWLIYDKR